MAISNGSYTFLYCNPISTFDVWTTNPSWPSEPAYLSRWWVRTYQHGCFWQQNNDWYCLIIWWKHVNTQLWRKHLNLQHPSPEPPRKMDSDFLEFAWIYLIEHLEDTFLNLEVKIHGFPVLIVPFQLEDLTTSHIWGGHLNALTPQHFEWNWSVQGPNKDGTFRDGWCRWGFP